MKKTLSKLVSSLIAAILILVVGCQQDSLPTVKNPVAVKLTEEQYLDSLCQSNMGLDPLWMIDTTVVKGSMGWEVSDTLSFDATDPYIDQSSKFIVSPIGYYDQYSTDKLKYAVFTRSYRFITLRAADSASQFGPLTGDTTLIITLLDFKQVSRPLPPNMDDFDREKYIWNFPHTNTNEKEICDSFLREYHPTGIYWIGGQHQFPYWGHPSFEGFYNNPSRRTFYANTDVEDVNFFRFVFKSGKYVPEDPFSNTIFWSEISYDAIGTNMEIRKQKLLDGREHRVMFLKIPYTQLWRHPTVKGFIRLRYVLD